MEQLGCLQQWENACRSDNANEKNGREEDVVGRDCWYCGFIPMNSWRHGGTHPTTVSTFRGMLTLFGLFVLAIAIDQVDPKPRVRTWPGSEAWWAISRCGRRLGSGTGNKWSLNPECAFWKISKKKSLCYVHEWEWLYSQLTTIFFIDTAIPSFFVKGRGTLYYTISIISAAYNVVVLPEHELRPQLHIWGSLWTEKVCIRDNFGGLNWLEWASFLVISFSSAC